MKRILFLLASLIALPLFADKPNVIVIMADDMGWECVSAYRDLITKYNYPKAEKGEKDEAEKRKRIQRKKMGFD